MVASAARRPSGGGPDIGRNFGSAMRDRRPLTCYLDFGVMLPIVFKEPASALVDVFMSTVQQEPWVSDFAAAEVASALSRFVRTGRLQVADGAVCLSDFDVWRAAMTRPVDTHAADVRLAGAFVRKFDLA